MSYGAPDSTTKKWAWLMKGVKSPYHQKMIETLMKNYLKVFYTPPVDIFDPEAVRSMNENEKLFWLSRDDVEVYLDEVGLPFSRVPFKLFLVRTDYEFYSKYRALF